MKLPITAAALVLAAVPTFAQSSMTGVSNPEPAIITATGDDTATTPATQTTPRPLAAKPSAATPASGEVYGPYVPYKGAQSAGTASTVAATQDTQDTPITDPDAQIVMAVPEREGTLREGTILRAQIQETLSTSYTVQGSRFTANMTEPVERNGRVIIPVGSIIDGQVTDVHGGRRISGAADLHLEARGITLPDGTHYILHAQVVGTSTNQFKVGSEGTLVRKDHPKEMLAIAGGVTGAGAVAGAMIGGGVGAVVGAGIGAGISTVVWLKQDRQATLPKDAQLVFTLTTTMILTPLSSGSMSSVGTASNTIAAAQ